jgi:hypothetical protein
MEERRTMGLGITAIALVVIAWLLLMLMSALLVYAELYLPGGIDGLTDESPISVAGAFSAMCSMIVNLIASVIAITGLIIRSERKFAPALALGLSLVLDVVLAGLIFIGIYFE